MTKRFPTNQQKIPPISLREGAIYRLVTFESLSYDNHLDHDDDENVKDNDDDYGDAITRARSK